MARRCSSTFVMNLVCQRKAERGNSYPKGVFFSSMLTHSMQRPMQIVTPQMTPFFFFEFMRQVLSDYKQFLIAYLILFHGKHTTTVILSRTTNVCAVHTQSPCCVLIFETIRDRHFAARSTRVKIFTVSTPPGNSYPSTTKGCAPQVRACLATQTVQPFVSIMKRSMGWCQHKIPAQEIKIHT